MRPIDMHNHMIAPEVISFLEREGPVRDANHRGERAPLLPYKGNRAGPINDKISMTEAESSTGRRRGWIQAISWRSLHTMFPNVAEIWRSQLLRSTTMRLSGYASSKYRDRVVPLASVPLQNPEAAARELERAMKAGARGVVDPPKVGEQGLDEPQFETFWAAAEANEAVVCIHPFDAAPSGMLARYSLGNAVGDLYDTGLAGALIVCGGVLEGAIPDCESCSIMPAAPSQPLSAGSTTLIASIPALSAPSPDRRPPMSSSSASTRLPSTLISSATSLGNNRSNHLVIGTDYPLDNGRATSVKGARTLVSTRATRRRSWGWQQADCSGWNDFKAARQQVTYAGGA